MTTREARGLAAADEEEQSIASYLQRTPDFFERHQAVLARLRLPHVRGGSTISLVERQIEVLREKLSALEGKLAELLRVARANDALSERLHRFTRRMLRAMPRDEALSRIEAGLREDFEAFQAVLVMIGEPSQAPATPRFRRYMTSERRLSAHTDRSYSRDLTALVRFCDRSGVADWDRLDTQHVRLFAAQSHASGLAPRSIQRRLSAVRSFYEFLLREGRDGATRGAAPASARRGTGARIRVNPAHDVRAPKAARRLPQTLAPDQMARLLEIPPGDALTARDRAIMELLYSSGLRLAELVGLDIASLDLRD